MTVLIRADASVTIGSGHVMRTLELARRLREAGYRIIYLCKSLEGDLTGLIRREGFDVRELPCGADEAEAIGHAIEEAEPYLLIIDHYGIGESVEKRLKDQYGIAIFCYDDTFERHHCDLLLNQNIYATVENYRGKVPLFTKVFAGVEYAAIRSEFYRAKERERTVAKKLRLLVTLGGSDPDNITSRVLEALGQFGDAFEITVVVGPSNAHLEQIERLGAALPCCRIIGDAPDMARLMAEADYAVTAAGQTTIEALFMELPTINIMIAENQRQISEYLQRHSLSISLKADFFTDELYAAVAGLLEGRGVSKEAIHAFSQQIGTCSVVDAVNCLRFEHFSIVPAVAEDMRPLFELANDAQVRANSLSTGPIRRKEHEAWFAKAMAEPLQRLYTLKDRTGAFMGQLRFDCREAGEAVISISIVKAARGCAVAPQIIRRGAALLFAEFPERTVKAVVRQNNPASLKSFERAGFKKSHEDADTVIYYLKKVGNEEH